MLDFAINIINAPVISGARAVQKCCSNTLRYTASNYGAANLFEWSITGATIVSGQGTDEVVVQPTANGNFSLNCEVGRQEADPLYLKSTSINIDRIDPVLPPIEGDRFLCLDEIEEYYVNLTGLCNVEKVVWTASAGIIKLDELEGGRIQIKPDPDFLYQKVTLKAQVQFIGGCISNIVEKEMQIFESGIPPAPDGYVEVDYGANFDPCNDYILLFNYVPKNLYENAILNVTPRSFVGVPHHIQATYVDVRVCYYNPCSDVESCTVFRIGLPAPCDDTRPMQLPEATNLAQSAEIEMEYAPFNKEKVERERSDLKFGSNVRCFPNPTADHIYFTNSIGNIGSVYLFDLGGSTVLRADNVELNQGLDIRNIADGHYIISVQTEALTFNQLISIQKGN